MKCPRSLMAILLLLGAGACRNDVHQPTTMEVVSMEKEINKSAPDHEICSSFTLTASQIGRYFTEAAEVDANTFHADAMILPCKYKGTIKISTGLLQWEIYAGGAGYLYRGESVNKRYLCKDKCCKALPGVC